MGKRMRRSRRRWRWWWRWKRTWKRGEQNKEKEEELRGGQKLRASERLLVQSLEGVEKKR